MSLSYSDSATLMVDPNFRGRIQVACVNYCGTIQAEPVDTPAHVSRLKWANGLMNNPAMIAQQLQPAVVMDPAIQAAVKPDASDIADSVVQTAVETAITTWQI